MSTTPTIPDVIKTTEQRLLTHHVTMSYLLVGIIIVMIACGGVFAYFSNKSYNAAMTKADAAEKQMVVYKQQSDAVIAQFQQQIALDTAARAADQQKIIALTNQIAAQNAAAQTAINNALKPGKSAQEAFADLSSAYRGVITPELSLSKDDKGEQLLGFRVPEVQRFTADKIDLDNKTQVIKEQEDELADKDDQIKSLDNDFSKSEQALTALQKTETACQQTVVDYKKVAVKSRFKRIMGGVLKGVIFGAGIIIGHMF